MVKSSISSLTILLELFLLQVKRIWEKFIFIKNLDHNAQII